MPKHQKKCHKINKKINYLSPNYKKTTLMIYLFCKIYGENMFIKLMLTGGMSI